MKIVDTRVPRRPARSVPLATALTVALLLVAGCTGDDPATSASDGAAGPTATTAGPTSPEGGGSASSAGSAGISPVLPVAQNPIANTSTVQALAIDSVLVENNVDGSGKDTSDHLEVALRNTGTAPLTSFEVYYTFTDPKTGDAESYYVRLPDSFSIPAGGRRVAHFDDTGATDHFPVNKFSIYHTDTNQLDVAVEVSAVDAARQTATTTKDAGGAEEAD